MPYQNFNCILLESIEDVFKQILGDEATIIISRYIERKGSIRWKNIPRRIEVLNEGLRELLGSGSIPIENLILENLYSKLGLNFKKNEDWTFLDYIKKLNNNTK